MPGLVPGIHVLLSSGVQDVDSRDKPGYDASELQVEHQPLAFAAGTADHHLGIGGLLLLGEDRVVVLGGARNHPLLASTADAEFAGVVDVYAGIEQYLQDALARRNDEFLSGARQLDHEPAFLLLRPRLGREILDVDLL